MNTFVIDMKLLSMLSKIIIHIIFFNFIVYDVFTLGTLDHLTKDMYRFWNCLSI